MLAWVMHVSRYLNPGIWNPTMYVIAYLTANARELVCISTPSLITAMHLVDALDRRIVSNVRIWRGAYDILGWQPDL